MMPAFTFTHHRVGGQLPHRDRHTLGPAFVLRDREEVECWVTAAAERQLLNALRSHRNTEWMGLVSGRPFQDSSGVYVVVTGAVSADVLDASAGHVRCHDAEFGRMSRRLPSLDPAGELIGWWHSHMGEFGYSAVDRNEQKLWTNENSIGILVLAGARTGAPSMVAYRGPRSIEMLPVPGTAPNGTVVGSQRAADRRTRTSEALAPVEASDVSMHTPAVRSTETAPRRSTHFDALLGVIATMSVAALIMSILALLSVDRSDVATPVSVPPTTATMRAPEFGEATTTLQPVPLPTTASIPPRSDVVDSPNNIDVSGIEVSPPDRCDSVATADRGSPTCTGDLVVDPTVERRERPAVGVHSRE